MIVGPVLAYVEDLLLSVYLYRCHVAFLLSFVLDNVFVVPTHIVCRTAHPHARVALYIAKLLSLVPNRQSNQFGSLVSSNSKR